MVYFSLFSDEDWTDLDESIAQVLDTSVVKSECNKSPKVKEEKQVKKEKEEPTAFIKKEERVPVKIEKREPSDEHVLPDVFIVCAEDAPGSSADNPIEL